MLARVGELEAQLAQREKLILRLCELLAAAAEDRLGALRRAGGRRAEAEALHRRVERALATLEPGGAPLASQRVAWEAGGGGTPPKPGGDKKAAKELAEELRGVRQALGALLEGDRSDEQATPTPTLTLSLTLALA